MFNALRKLFGNSPDNPQGRTGNQWNQQDFQGKDPLVTVGAPEFIEFCKSQGTCELNGAVLEKFKSIIQRFPVEDSDDDDDDDEYDPQDHFAVVVRDGLIQSGLIPPNDPNRYQYQISMGFVHYSE